MNKENILNLQVLEEAARIGIEYAIKYIDQSIDTKQITFWVKEIVAHPFDSDPGTVAYAACHATWALFNINSIKTIQLGAWLVGKQ
ncbi:hypothetical protein [Nostoc sp. TCL26-01]|uniref:hypothetical protein n=1 Tax=Nostoc sp. TCL26-01 TaxID=2576904 RepID=UPI0015C0A9D5|nr:hypothetical protein [Nostoc sp. TCL26-01]QLE58941.1 hypothetical protein FD725_27640 [Nostoc sp. TCL26-01]